MEKSSLSTTRSEKPVVFLKKILVTTDLSEYSLEALEYATTFNLLGNAEVFLLFVAENNPGRIRRHHGNTEDSAGRMRQVLGEAERQLDLFVLKNVSSELNIRRAVRAGSPVEEILRFSREEGIDLIILATHGRTGLRHMVMGSVAEKVVRLSGTPVLTVKPGPFRERILKNEDIENELHLRTY